MTILECSDCGYERTSEQDGRIFMHVDEDNEDSPLVCLDCWATSKERHGQVN